MYYISRMVNHHQGHSFGPSINSLFHLTHFFSIVLKILERRLEFIFGDGVTQAFGQAISHDVLYIIRLIDISGDLQ